MDSKFATFDGLKMHYWEGGSGFPVLMLHGVGPGTSIVGNFGPVLEPLSRRLHLFAMDLIGFGQSDRNNAQPYFDVELWVRQALAMIETMPDGPIGVAGHSLGGALALKVAARSGRVVKVLTSCTVGSSYPINEALLDFWSMPADRDGLRRAMGRMAFSSAAVTDDMIEDRWRQLNQPGYPEYFGELFADPKQRLLDAAVLSDDELGRIGARVVMLHGRDDRPCPPEMTTLPLASRLPAADVILLGRCGHNLPRERAADYLQSAFALFASE
jgi:2-hydroxymuconate-semialdehyde hydrolase